MIKFIKAVFMKTSIGWPLLVSLGFGLYLTVNALQTVSGIEEHSISDIFFGVFVMTAVLTAYFFVWCYSALLIMTTVYGMALFAVSDKYEWAYLEWTEFIGALEKEQIK